MKFCKDCTYFKGTNFATPVCIQAKVCAPDPVLGAPQLQYCYIARLPSGVCGEDALYFRAKDEK